jgi:hypothetical protein
MLSKNACIDSCGDCYEPDCNHLCISEYSNCLRNLEVDECFDQRNQCTRMCNKKCYVPNSVCTDNCRNEFHDCNDFLWYECFTYRFDCNEKCQKKYAEFCHPSCLTDFSLCMTVLDPKQCFGYRSQCTNLCNLREGVEKS